MTEPATPPDHREPEPGTMSRRRALGISAAVGAVVGGGAAAAALRVFDTPDATGNAGAPEGSAVRTIRADGPTQAGIDRPETPQRHCLITVIDLPDDNTGFLHEWGATILALTGGGPTDTLPDGPGDLTITIGLGPRLVTAVDPALPGAQDLPAFARDTELTGHTSGGDVLLAINTSDPSVLGPVQAILLAAVPQARTRWTQHGYRGPGTGTIVRNPLGFDDGIIVPHTPEELSQNVWLGEPLTGATICVIRRLRINTTGFHTLPLTEQEQVIGRHKIDGTPLSGGLRADQVNLGAKSPDGQYLVPARSHTRAAHPSFTGSTLMLRRGYAYDNGITNGGTADAGLLFICYQNNLRTFTATQQRLDDTDDLMDYVTTTASGTFLILPGHTRDTPLGAGLKVSAR